MLTRKYSLRILIQLTDPNNMKFAFATLSTICLLTLPWIKLDGGSSSMSGAELIRYTISGAGRWTILQEHPLAMFAVMTIPLTTLLLSLSACLTAWRGGESIPKNLAIIVLPTALLLLAGAVSDSGDRIIFGITSPKAGIILGIIFQALVIYMDSRSSQPWPVPGYRKEESEATPEYAGPGHTETPEQRPEAGSSGQFREPEPAGAQFRQQRDPEPEPAASAPQPAAAPSTAQTPDPEPVPAGTAQGNGARNGVPLIYRQRKSKGSRNR